MGTVATETEIGVPWKYFLLVLPVWGMFTAAVGMVFHDLGYKEGLVVCEHPKQSKLQEWRYAGDCVCLDPTGNLVSSSCEAKGSGGIACQK